jgi:hypothetical protein
MQSERQIPIWFFIGALLLIYGLIILGTGLYGLEHPSQVHIHLEQARPDASWFFLHPDIWWSVVLVAIGAFYCLRFNPLRKPTSDE